MSVTEAENITGRNISSGNCQETWILAPLDVFSTCQRRWIEMFLQKHLNGRCSELGLLSLSGVTELQRLLCEQLTTRVLHTDDQFTPEFSSDTTDKWFMSLCHNNVNNAIQTLQIVCFTESISTSRQLKLEDWWALHPQESDWVVINNGGWSLFSELQSFWHVVSFLTDPHLYSKD